MSDDLEALKAALTRQLDAIDGEARHHHVTRELFRDANGSFVAVPVLVALAQVEIALLAQRAPALCGDVPSWGEHWPCVLLPGHPMPHVDRDGDEWSHA